MKLVFKNPQKQTASVVKRFFKLKIPQNLIKKIVFLGHIFFEGIF